jgi:photosystem II stability/assembly factor-like uncharacterized protein
MKSQIFVALFIAATQLLPSGCSSGSLAYIPPITGTVFTGPDEAWVLKHKGELKRISIDGQSIKVTDAQQRVQDMSFISPTQAWTVDSDRNVWHFDGVNWAFVGHNSDNKFVLGWPSSLSFADENVGWARTFRGLFVTDDGGRNWRKVLATELGGEPSRIFVVDIDTVYLYSSEVGVGGSVKRTVDRGKTWKSIDLGTAGDVTSFACRDDGRECWAGTARGELFSISKDSARSMPLPKTFGKIGIFSISFDSVSGSSFLAGLKYRDGAAGSGLLLRTDDGGQTWNGIEAPQSVRTDNGVEIQNKHIDNQFRQVASFGDTIWLAGATAIYRSSDRGNSWAKVYDAAKRKE